MSSAYLRLHLTNWTPGLTLEMLRSVNCDKFSEFSYRIRQTTVEHNIQRRHLFANGRDYIASENGMYGRALSKNWLFSAIQYNSSLLYELMIRSMMWYNSLVIDLQYI